MISISGYHIREAGATAVQEIAFTLANAIAYVQAALDRGLKIDSFANRLSFFFAAHNDLLEEVAKFRASRRLWAKIMKNRFNAQNPRSWLLRFHTQTSGVTLTAQQPHNNIVRVTLQALAGILGGTQSLHTNSMDEAMALPSEKAVSIALRTQQVLAHESGITNTIDPLAGAYYIETLTDQIEQEAQNYIERIEAMGGILKAIEQGFIQREIQNSAYRHQKAVEKQKRVIVGVNRYQTDEEVPIKLLKVDPVIERKQVEKLKRYKRARKNKVVTQSLDQIRSTASTEDNLVYPILDAIKAKATLGEICDSLRDVFGEYIPPRII
jgi:methylmalonyl-CoA mutase N-terminal domain/subunit